MFFYEGQSCPVCGQRFNEADDIVTCPQCGAPHHRACWKSEGHCHFADTHGTDRQWAATRSSESEYPQAPTKRCPNCGKDNPEFSEFCSQCGREFPNKTAWEQPPHHTQTPPPVGQYTPPPYGDYAPFRMPMQDPYGGVPRNETIDGISVETIAEIVGPNTAYYLPRFYKMSHGGSKLSWNWMAFLLPYNWLLFRKNLGWGGAVFAFSMVLSFFQYQATAKIDSFLQGDTYTALYQSMQQLILSGNARLFIAILFITSIISFLLSILCGMFGNYLYLQTVLKKARKLQNDPDGQYNRNFQTTGGTSFALAAAPYLVIYAVQYLLLLLSL